MNTTLSLCLQVTVFQTVRNPGKPETFSFIVDSSLKNMTIYLTGNSLVFNITSPLGVQTNIEHGIANKLSYLLSTIMMTLFTSTGDSQTNEELSGKLGLVEQVGNFYTVRLTILDPVGLWNIYINSLQRYTIKVLGNFFLSHTFTNVDKALEVQNIYR